jgi:hypothetical protein
MSADRSRYGLLVSSVGAILLAVAVFLPWYGLSLTASGVAFVQRLGDQVVAQYGNAALQGYLGPLHANIGSLAGQQLAAVSAHQVLKDLNIVLLVLAGLALLDALLPLVRAAALPDGAGASLVLLGSVASACVLYRMIVPPAPTGGELLSVSLREGSWLALLGSLMMLAGGLWPRTKASTSDDAGQARLEGNWSALSGWTPQS